MFVDDLFDKKSLTESQGGGSPWHSEPEQQQMDADRRGRLERERNAGLDEPDDAASGSVPTGNGVYEYTVPAGQESTAQELGLQQHRGHWVSRVPIQRANFQFGQPQFHEIPSQGVAEGLLNEFAPGNGGGDSGRWYTDSELADIIGDDWFEDFDVSNDGFNMDAYGEKAKKNLVGYANAWFDDRGYNVNVLGVENNEVDHDLQWYVVGSFQNDNFADKNIDEGDVVPLGKKHRGDLDSVNSCSKCGGKLEGGTYMGQRIKVCQPCKQVYLPPNSGIDQQGNKIKEQGVAEGSLNEGQYEMMMRNGQVKKFIAKDDADAKRIAAGHGAKSVIKLRGGVPAGKVAEQGVAEGSDHSLKKVWDRYSKHLMAAQGHHPDVRQIYKSGDIVQNIRKYVKDHHGQRAVDDMERYAEKHKWDAGVTEGMMDNPGDEDSPVAQAIIRRILMQRTDLLAKHGPEKVGQAVDEVADFVGDVEEIGSSDVSGWVRHVEQMLGNMEQSVEETSISAQVSLPKWQIGLTVFVKHLGQKGEIASLGNDSAIVDVGMRQYRVPLNGLKRYPSQGVAEGKQVNEVFNIVPNLEQQIAKKEDELKALKAKLSAKTTTNAGIQTGATALIDPDTKRPYEKDKLAAMYGYKEPVAEPEVTPPAPAAQTSTTEPVAQTPAQIRAAKQKAAAATAQGQMASNAPATAAQPTPAQTRQQKQAAATTTAQAQMAAKPGNYDPNTGAAVSDKAKASAAFDASPEGQQMDAYVNALAAGTFKGNFQQWKQQQQTAQAPAKTGNYNPNTGAAVSDKAKADAAFDASPEGQQMDAYVNALAAGTFKGNFQQWKQQQQTAQAPAATTVAPTTNPAGFDAGNVMKLPGMQNYAKPATAVAPKTANFGAGPAGYAKTTTSIKPPAAPSSPALAAPSVPKVPRVTAGGPTPAEKANLEKRLAAAAPAVAETLQQIDRMLESVTSKKSAEIIKAYADQRFTELGLRNTTECKQIMAHVVHESAVRRRAYAQRMAK